jgi:hypothetical protein
MAICTSLSVIKFNLVNDKINSQTCLNYMLMNLMSKIALSQ